MKSQVIKEQIKRHEGFVSHAYRDTEGYLTIGYGRLIDERRGGGVSKSEADHMLTNDLQRVVVQIEERWPGFNHLNDTRQHALINMGFNLGVNGLFSFTKMFDALQEGDYEQAAHEALDSKWATQVGQRAVEIAEMIQHGQT